MTLHTVAIVDDHFLVAKAFGKLLAFIDGYSVQFDASSGMELIRQIQAGQVPDIVLLDINMPEMDGFEVARWLKHNAPTVKVLALTMNDKEESIVGMLRNGARGYLLKECRPSELKAALDDLMTKGYHYTDYITDRLIRSLNLGTFQTPAEKLGLNERELAFLQLACSDLTYEAIADKMCLSKRTIDGYRESIFEKMNVKSRVSMAIEAIKLRLVDID
jgi:two-component system invasion response regulator UvrY